MSSLLEDTLYKYPEPVASKRDIATEGSQMEFSGCIKDKTDVFPDGNEKEKKLISSADRSPLLCLSADHVFLFSRRTGSRVWDANGGNV